MPGGAGGTGTAYPKLATDIANISYTEPTASITVNTSITIASIIIEDLDVVTLTITSGTLQTGTLTIGDTGQGTNTTSYLTIAGAGQFTITGATTISYSSRLLVSTGGSVTLGTTVALTGKSAARAAELETNGGTMTASSTTFTLNNYSIMGSLAGTFNATACTYTLSGTNAQFLVSGGTFSALTSGTFTLSGAGANLTASGGNFYGYASAFTLNGNGAFITVTGGSFTAYSGGSFTLNSTTGQDYISVPSGSFTTTSCNYTFSSTVVPYFENNGGTTAINTCTIALSGSGPYMENTSGTSTYAGCTFNVIGTYYYLGFGEYQYPGIYQNGGTTNIGDSNSADASTVNLSGAYGALYADAGTLNFGASCVANLSGTNALFQNDGTGITTCYSTSVINLSGANAELLNYSNSAVNDPFTLLSDAKGSATIGQITGSAATVQGTFNVQRYCFADGTLSGSDYAYRNYKLLSCSVNQTSYIASTTGGNLVDLSYLGKTFTTPGTYNGAYIAGPSTYASTFGTPASEHTSPNALIYLYQESTVPGATGNSTFYSGKSAGVIGLDVSTANTVNVTGTASGGPGTNVQVKVPAGNGYLLYYIGNNTRATLTNPLTNTVAPGSSTITASGYINQGSILFYLWNTNPNGNNSQKLTITPTGVTSGSQLAGVTIVGNPYPSSIDLQQVWIDNKAALGTTATTFYELDDLNHQYDTYNTSTGTSGLQASRYIESGQGFYIVTATANKTLTFNEDQKVNNFPSVSELAVRIPTIPVQNNLLANNAGKTDAMNNLGDIDSSKTPNNFLNLSAVNNLSSSSLQLVHSAILKSTVRVPSNLPAPSVPQTTAPAAAQVLTVANAGLHLKLVQDSATFDECGIYFNSAWSDNFDSNDSKDLDGLSGNVYLSSYSSDNVRTSINAMNNYTVAGGKRIKLFAKFSATGIYKLQLEDLVNFKSGSYSVFLLDNLLKDSLDLTLYKSYNFNYTPGTANDSTRFVLAIEHKPVPQYALLSFAGAKNTDGVLLDWKTINEANNVTFVLQKLGANDAYAFLDSLHSDSAGAYSYIDQHPILGNNTYRLQQTDDLGHITYSAPVTIGYNSSSPNGGLNIYPNPAKSTITVTLTSSSTVAQVATADIYNTSGTLVEHKVLNCNSFTHDVSSYQLGVYVIELKNSNGIIVGKSKFVKVE
jgi:hypothetical protein